MARTNKFSLFPLSPTLFYYSSCVHVCRITEQEKGELKEKAKVKAEAEGITKRSHRKASVALVCFSYFVRYAADVAGAVCVHICSLCICSSACLLGSPC